MIFISYSRTEHETRLATLLERGFTAAKLEVWRDTTQIRVGEQFAKEIEEGIQKATWVVFLVSNSWLDSAWCQNELTLAIKHHGSAARCLPVLRAPSDRVGKRLPVPFKDLNLLTWLEDERDPGAKLAELHARIAGINRRADELSATGRALIDEAGLGDLVDQLRGATSAPPTQDPPSFYCDRAPQWTTVSDLLGSGRHDLAVVRGPCGEYHEHFLDRVTRALPQKPERTIVPVRWQRRPVGKDDFLGSLATSLGLPDPARLGDHLRQRLSQRHLVLVHGCIRGDFDDDDLVDYYASWLPDLVADVRGSFHLKCVQALEWQHEALFKRLLGWGAKGDDDKTAAEHLVERVESSQRQLTVVRLRELAPITAQELKEFCDTWVEPHHRQPLLGAVAQAGKTSEEMLRAIDRYLLRARTHERDAVVETVSR